MQRLARPPRAEAREGAVCEELRGEAEQTRIRAEEEEKKGFFGGLFGGGGAARASESSSPNRIRQDPAAEAKKKRLAAANARLTAEIRDGDRVRVWPRSGSFSKLSSLEALAPLVISSPQPSSTATSIKPKSSINLLWALARTCSAA